MEKGATTIWETWDAISPDGQVNISSFNHYSFGCVGDWMYRVIAGLDKDQPGYKHIIIRPRPYEQLTHARASYQSIYGEIVSAWELQNGTMHLHAQMPPNTTATIRLPNATLQTITNIDAKQDGTDVVLEVGSGPYDFEYPYR